ncbi:hypothetical protein CTAYLR_007616 [Chrysophaeum taylorii]|uniref:VPS9 domain-containing protein n=1 Tax=Chrysophaeum taylorii TaxID=2483200 RepID=A0AAD7U750_9STRA|nr:hypothetical protein CTAYLR_007616 [Chrysophaeum taylorii]
MRWAHASESECLAEVSRRSRVTSAWRASFRRGIPFAEPAAGCWIQCFQNRLTGFADWAELRQRFDGSYFVVLHAQQGVDVALRRFSMTEVMDLGELLDRYEEVRVNNNPNERTSKWADATTLACGNELERRARRPVQPGETVMCGGVECVLERGGDYEDAPWVAKIGAETLSLGEFLDKYPTVNDDDDDDDDPAADIALERRLLRPPPKRAPFDDAFSVDRQRGLERAAQDLFVPVIARSRRERTALDLEASAAARAADKDDIEEDDELWGAARKAAAGALRCYFTGIAFRRPADVLYDALIAERSYKHWIPDPNPVVAVAAYVSRSALADASTAPGAVLAVVNDHFFRPDAVGRACAAARVVLDSLLRYHPALGSRREATIAALEAVDAALFGDDDAGSSTKWIMDDSDRAARELRYQAVLDSLRDRVEDLPDRAALLEKSRSSGGEKRPSLAALDKLPLARTARGKLRALVATLEALAAELGETGVASDDLMPALCDTLLQANLQHPAAEIAFAKRFCRDEKLLLGADGYALTSFEIALAALRETCDQEDDLFVVAQDLPERARAVSEETPVSLHSRQQQLASHVWPRRSITRP